VIELAAAATAAAGICAGPMVSRYVGEARLARLCARERVLCLTYDDGPGRSLTPRLLDLLQERGARATFFALGHKAAGSADLLDRMRSEGHEVACHTERHLHAWRTLPWSSSHDVTSGFRSLERWMPATPLFRPPYGKLTPLTWAAARRANARFAWWTDDSGDTWDALPRPQRVVDSVRARGGGVVLFHDFDREDARADYVLRLTEDLLALAASAGLRIVPQGALLTESRSFKA
jgi:peptidoglycan-N-acetylglucosamine deacetylase